MCFSYQLLHKCFPVTCAADVSSHALLRTSSEMRGTVVIYAKKEVTEEDLKRLKAGLHFPIRPSIFLNLGTSQSSGSWFSVTCFVLHD